MRVQQKGNTIQLDEVHGIDILGDVVEASSLSPNPNLYGSLHNHGHTVISYAHDPEGTYLEDFGVMGDVATAMRDPLFYRWHSFIDFVFKKFKNSLPSYVPATHFNFKDVVVDTVGVLVDGDGDKKPNILITHWQKSNIDLAAALDFGPKGNVLAQFTHLQHAPFNYNITATNNR